MKETYSRDTLVRTRVVNVQNQPCARRLKDFVGALKDYDEAAFQHYQGVHVGKAALHNAAALLHGSLEHTDQFPNTRTAAESHGNGTVHNRAATERGSDGKGRGGAGVDREASTTDDVAGGENNKKGGSMNHGAEKGTGTQQREARKAAGYGGGEGGQRLERRLERGPDQSFPS